MSSTQKTIIVIAEYAKQNSLDPVGAVQEYFDEKGSHFPREKVAEILARARAAQRKECVDENNKNEQL